MARIEWDQSLSVGVDLIDDQHKMLIQKLRNIAEAIEKKQATGEIAKTLNFMVDYTDFHFSTEEKYMEEYSYPGRENHIQQHEEFKESLKRLVQDFQEEGATQVLSSSISTFLLNWLIKHIKGIDIGFGEFLREKGFLASSVDCISLDDSR
ncbi:MAG: hemerythrin family protein [Candidatus Thorarchaeota archaeon]|nr:MAG: hemerythrin family protein [Candidatus Thorarchaeota archaeon]